MRRKSMMQFRVTDVEKSLIQKCATACEMSVSEYVRMCLLIEIMDALEERGITLFGVNAAKKAKEVVVKQVMRTGNA